MSVWTGVSHSSPVAGSKNTITLHVNRFNSKKKKLVSTVCPSVTCRIMTQAEREQENEKEKDKEREKDKEKEQRGVKRPIVPPVIPEPLQEVSDCVISLASRVLYTLFSSFQKQRSNFCISSRV